MRDSTLAARIVARLQEDHCGCAMGARFLAVTLVGSLIWYAWHWQTFGQSVGGALLHIFVLSFVAATGGKIVGLVLSRYASRIYRLLLSRGAQT